MDNKPKKYPTGFDDKTFFAIPNLGENDHDHEQCRQQLLEAISNAKERKEEN